MHTLRRAQAAPARPAIACQCTPTWGTRAQLRLGRTHLLGQRSIKVAAHPLRQRRARADAQVEQQQGLVPPLCAVLPCGRRPLARRRMLPLCC